ncbi:MAG: hypothetical protein IJY04_05655, partial [Clostridia bacterium]|nr:hypothetical protein [Clostridia bacterium]
MWQIFQAQDEVSGASSSFWGWAWSVLSSPLAVGIYVIIVLGGIIALVAILLAEERNRPDPETLRGYIDRINEIKRNNMRDSYIVPVKVNGGNSPQANTEEEEPEGEEKRERAPRFCMLRETDERLKGRLADTFEKEASFSAICEGFRNFCATRMKLYYDIEDIRRFIASLTVTKLIVMQGMSGT